MRDVALHTTVVAAQNQVSSQLRNEVMVLGLERGQYYGLQGAGALIWELIQSPRVASEVCDAVHARYAVERNRCEDDVISFLRDLCAQGLAVVAQK